LKQNFVIGIDIGKRVHDDTHEEEDVRR